MWTHQTNITMDSFKTTTVATSFSSYYNINDYITTTNISDQRDYACYEVENSSTGVMTSHVVFIVVSTLCVIVGSVGNSLSLLVFSSKNMISLSSNVYLCVLSVSDTCYLLTVFFSRVLPTLRCVYFPSSSFDFSNSHASACITLQFFLDLFSDYSTCLILAFTVERFLACYYAIWFRDMCNATFAWAICIFGFFGIIIFISPYHLMYMGHYKDYKYCTILPDYAKKFSILYTTEAVLFRIIPVVIIAVLNCRIIAKVSELSRQRTNRRASTLVGNNKVCGAIESKDDRHFQLTILLLVVSSSYIILYFPALIHFFIRSIQHFGTSIVSESTMTISKNYTSVLYVMGFAINFFLYTLSGRIFRDQLNYLLCKAKKTYQEINNMNGEETTANMTNLNTSTTMMNTKL